ncbi:tetrathionate reductase subunit TtrC [Yersinia nurmii]|uniref:Tetrathionate reductase subunit TtrC n=1 Tax=Yersinia nurmii TaxID=685706 RepID=A0AAW7JSX7_9GAMM|nr:tetrathionate reductase subunit TtrC [Yersinia nurmii]MDN0086032.1 tetrathionate reductase subunit TtrC [Yersinia nurmii]
MIREILARPQEISWLPWAVQYFFFIGLACGAVLLGCWQRWFRRDKGQPLERAALMLAVTAAIVAPLALSADLHQPARAWHFYPYFTPWSWMSWGSLFLPLFSGLVVTYFLALIYGQRVNRPLTGLLRLLSILTALSALSILMYTGREVSVLRAQPLWFTLWLPLFIFLTAMQAVPSLLALWLWRQPQVQRYLARWQLVSLLFLALVTLLWASGSTLSAAALRQWASGHPLTAAAPLLIGLMLLGLALLNLTRRLSIGAVILQSLLAMVLCWMVRWLLLMQSQTLPKYNVLTHPYQLSLGTDGLLAIIGTFGLWVTLIIALREGVRRWEGRVQHG